MYRKDRVRFFFVLLIALIIILSLSIVILRNYQGNIRMESYTFTESSRELQNPGRGFYYIYRFKITDQSENYWQLIRELYKADQDTSLSLVEINLQDYRDNIISESGLENIDALFQALSDLDKQLIVRFVYDWDGENEKFEPETIDIILKHMEQLKGILHKFSTQILILQGLFIGNWGEMNGTRYSGDEDLIRLTEQLYQVTDRSTFLAVRTPSQWRRITGLQNISEDALEEHPLAKRISLYNDGMLGNETDYGTYKMQVAGEQRISEREKELSFQEQLCCWVPNGGEVINDNSYNDLSNAIKDLETMHVTYLNAGHDQTVLNKWKETEITEEGCFQGLDGYTYIERHLGYRLLISTINFHHNSFSDYIDVSVSMKNRGFAPLYTEPNAEIVLYNRDNEELLSYEMQGNLCKLTGGNEKDKEVTLQAAISIDEVANRKYEVYFTIVDPNTGDRILLANEQNADAHGYCIGNIELYK